MYIHEAIKEALETGGGVSRPIYGECFVVPIHPRDTCWVAAPGMKRVPRWEPSVEDLTASDWEVHGKQAFEGCLAAQ